MINQEESVRMRRRESKKAIDLAMEGKWREAVDANKSLIENFADDVDAYNRLGRAYTELGEYREAESAYKRALELDPYNVIARKATVRLSHITGAAVATVEPPPREDAYHRVEPYGFIEETGKAGVVSLYRLAPVAVLAGMVAGDKAVLRVEGQNLAVINGRGDFVGLVEPKHAHRLIRLISGGNRYSATVVSVNEDSVSIIIHEEYQHPAQAGTLSFPPKGFERIRSYIDERLRRELEQEETYTSTIHHLDEGDMSSRDTGGYGEGDEEE